jgi:hypothetical protein
VKQVFRFYHLAGISFPKINGKISTLNFFYFILLFLFVKLFSVLIKDTYVVCRYFAAGNSFNSLHYEYIISATIVGEIVRGGYDAI